MKELKKLPTFKDEAEESAFWDENDVTEYFDTLRPRGCISTFKNKNFGVKNFCVRHHLRNKTYFFL